MFYKWHCTLPKSNCLADLLLAKEKQKNIGLNMDQHGSVACWCLTSAGMLQQCTVAVRLNVTVLVQYQWYNVHAFNIQHTPISLQELASCWRLHLVTPVTFDTINMKFS